MLFRNCSTLALAGWMSVAVWPAMAEEVSLDAAVRRTLAQHPALRAEGLTVAAFERQAELDGLAPAPTLSADLENVAGSGTLSGVHSAEATLRLGQIIELGGKRAAREARGRTDVVRQQQIVRRLRLDLAAATTRRYIAVAQGQHELALSERQAGLARDTEVAVMHRVDRGVAPETDQTLARIAVVRAEIAHEHADHELASAQFALTALWGEARMIPIEATGDLLALPELPDFEVLADRLRDAPEAVAYLLEADRLAADRAVATASARPDVTLSLGVRRLEALNDQGLVLSVAVPFGTGTRSNLALARNAAESGALDARQQSASLEARQLLFARFQELRHARTEFRALTERMLPAAEQGLALTQSGYDNARYSILQLTQAQATLLQLQQERLTAAARYHQLLAEIERSTAAPGANP